MEEIGLNPQDADARKIVERYQNASRVGVSSERYADALEAMDSLFYENPRAGDKLDISRLTASTKPMLYGADEGRLIIHNVTGDNTPDGYAQDGVARYTVTGKRFSPVPNYVMDWTAQQSVKAVTSSVAAQARSSGNGNRLPAVPLDFNIQQGATGRKVHDMQRVISSYVGYNQPVLGRAGSTSLANLERFKKDYAAGARATHGGREPNTGAN